MVRLTSHASATTVGHRRKPSAPKAASHSSTRYFVIFKLLLPTAQWKQFAELERKQQAERRVYGKHIKQRAEQLVKTIKAEHQKKVAQLRDKQGREQHDQQMEHSRQSQEQAKEIRSGRDREVFAAERRAARKRDLAEQKREVTTAPEHKPESSLRAKFQKARGRDRAGGLADHYRETKENIAKDKRQSFKENADDLSRDVGRERSRKPKGPSSKPE